MAFIPVPNVVELELIYSVASQVVENTFYFTGPAGYTDVEMQDLAVAVAAEWNALLKIYIPNDVSLTQIKLTDLTSAIAPVIQYGTGLPLAGTRGAGMLPNNVSLAFTRRTANRGRSYRGRIYWPGFIEADVLANVVLSTIVTQIIGQLMAFNQVIASSGTWNQVVVSRFTGNAPRTNGIATPITGWTSDGLVDSQRRRLPGRGA